MLLAENKTTGLTTVLRYLGFEIDTLLMMIRIPQEMIDKLRSMLQYGFLILIDAKMS
jgi:hypothetical protein